MQINSPCLFRKHRDTILGMVAVGNWLGSNHNLSDLCLPIWANTPDFHDLQRVQEKKENLHLYLSRMWIHSKSLAAFQGGVFHGKSSKEI